MVDAYLEAGGDDNDDGADTDSQQNQHLSPLSISESEEPSQTLESATTTSEDTQVHDGDWATTEPQGENILTDFDIVSVHEDEEPVPEHQSAITPEAPRRSGRSRPASRDEWKQRPYSPPDFRVSKSHAAQVQGHLSA